MKCPIKKRLEFDGNKCRRCKQYRACKTIYENEKKNKDSVPGDNYPNLPESSNVIDINKYYFMRQIEYCIRCGARGTENCGACQDNPCKRVAEFRETRNLKEGRIKQTDVLDVIIDVNLYKGQWIK